MKKCPFKVLSAFSLMVVFDYMKTIITHLEIEFCYNSVKIANNILGYWVGQVFSQQS